MSIVVTNNSQAQEAVAAKAAGGESASVPADEAEQKKEAATQDTAATEEVKEKTEDADESDEADEAESDLDASEKDEKPKRKSGAQRRKERAERAEAEVARLQRLVEEMAFKNAGSKDENKPAATKAAAPDTAGKPKPEDFETHAEWVDAVVDWKVEQRDKATKAEAEKAKLESARKQTLDEHFERERAFSEKTPDYKETIEGIIDLPFSVAAQDAITRSGLGPEILYELGKDPKEALRVAKLPPGDAYKAIGKIEAKIELRASTETKPEPKKLTQAPKPLTPVGGKGAAVEKSINDPNIPQKDYEAIRRKQIAARRGW